MTTTPNQIARRGNLFIVPVGPTIAEVSYPTQSFTKPPDFSLWVHGQIQEPGLHLDRARMSTNLYREVRDDVTRYSPVEVTRSAFRRSAHAYVGVIDSRGTPYYFALDSRGVSVREAPRDDDRAWKAFDRLSEDEHMMAVRQRRADAAEEMREVDRELSSQVIVVTKGIRYGKKIDWKRDSPRSTWWRNVPRKIRERSSDEAEKSDVTLVVGERYAAEMRRLGAELADDADEEDLDPPRPDDVGKALPRAGRDDAGTKKTKSGKASKKQAGAGGRTRYTYPQEKPGPRQQQGGQVPLVVVHDDTKHADPAELASQLGVSVRTLSHAARRLGREEFSRFMRAHLKRFAAKHRLDPDYWGTVYARLVTDPAGIVAKSDAAGGKFGRDVNRAASSVPGDHPERFGDRKVFIHHVHQEMRRRGTFGGSLDEFKDRLVQAHRDRHVVLSRADYVAAMNPHSVGRSETTAAAGGGRGATFHFVNHEPSSAEAASQSDPGGAARSASSAAAESTVRAGETGSSEDHLAAMQAHHRAGVAHQKASGKTNDRTALRHFKQSMSHLSASKVKA